MDTIYVKTTQATTAEKNKIIKILDAKFNGYHSEVSSFFAHCSTYGVLVIEEHGPAYSTRNRVNNIITVKQFLAKYQNKKISLKGIQCK